MATTFNSSDLAGKILLHESIENEVFSDTTISSISYPEVDSSIVDDSPSDQTTIVPPLGDHTHTVIFLHGREDYGEDLAQSFFDSKASDQTTSLAQIFPNIRWVFPTSKFRYCAYRDFEFSQSSFAEALKGEEIISQWFDLWDINEPEEREDLQIPGLQETIADIVEIIQEEAKIVPLDKIALGGISMGQAAALLTLLSSGMKLGGYLGFCSWLPFQQRLFERLPSAPTMISTDEIAQHVNKILQISNNAENENGASIDATIKENDIDEPAELLKWEDADDSGSIRRTGDIRGICDYDHFKDLPRWDYASDSDDFGSLDNQTAKLGTSPAHKSSAPRTPIFIAHSEDDGTVLFGHGVGLYQSLEKMGFDVSWKGYEDGGHWIHPTRGVNDIADFLRQILDN